VDITQSVNKIQISSIPNNWRMAELNELGEIVTGRTPSTKKPEYYGGSYMFISPGDIDENMYVERTEKCLSKDGINVSRILHKDTVLVVCIGATIGKTALTSAEKSATNQQINAIMPNEKVSSHFLYYSLKFNSDELPALAGRAAIPIINKSNFSKFMILLPPLPEQRAISRVLRAVQQAREARLREIALERERKAALMEHLFRHGTRGEATKQTDIGEMPVSWESKRLNEIAAIERGKFTHRPRNDPAFYGGAIPFIQTGDVATCNGWIKTFSQTLNDRGLSVSKIFPKGTIAITIAANIGFTGILEFDSAFPDSLIGITPVKQVNNEFLNYYLSTQQKKMDEIAPRGTQKNINIEFLSPWPIFLPSLQEQKEISSILHACDAKIAALEHEANLHDELFRAILEELMTGRLRVGALAEKLHD
jgi:type I restriction enzyme, S subunit